MKKETGDMDLLSLIGNIEKEEDRFRAIMDLMINDSVMIRKEYNAKGKLTGTFYCPPEYVQFYPEK